MLQRSSAGDVGFQRRMAHVHLNNPNMTTISDLQAHRRSFRVILYCAMAIAVFFGLAATKAQPAPAPATPAPKPANDEPVKLEEMVVNSVRGSLITAQEIKQNSPEFVDSVVAQDIGKLP